jgi:hypothetical protein
MLGWLLNFFLPVELFCLSEGRQLPIDVVGFVKNYFLIAGLIKQLFVSVPEVESCFDGNLLKCLESSPFFSSLYLL